MASPPDRPIILELVVRSGHPALLEGLDAWLRLGLLSDETVRQLCEDHLSCLLSEVRVRSHDDFAPNDFAPNDFAPNDLAPEETRVPVGAGSAVEHPPSPIARGVQSFMAEVSVIWLLFLGVFMVVVSSGVLAATQWRNFSPVVQYGILFAYTLAFWAASVWTGRQASLRLTARMLQIATLLIIPVNFWMMDGFHLWQSGLGWVMAAIAALVLTGITVQLLRPGIRRGVWDVESRDLLPLGAAIALSWLHWGWGWAGFPLVATYVGTIGATIALVWQERELGVGSRESGVRSQKSEVRSQEGEAAGETGAAGEAVQNSELRTQNSDLHPSPLTPHPSPPLSTITIAIATLLLIARAVLAAGVPINRLGLAVGICGWLLCWLGRRDASRMVWQRGGAGLLLAGWLIAVTVTPPWQAIAISGLGLWLLADYLRRSGQAQYLVAGWLVGLQTVWLLWRAVPTDWQQRMIETSIRLTGQEAMPVALLGLAVFPYVLLTIWLAANLRRWQRPNLAKHTEWLALSLGIVLTAVSVGNGWTRSLNLVLSTVTLLAVLRGRTRPEAALIYLTHGTGLAAIASLINLWFPHLSQNTWAALLLAGAIAEWTFTATLLSPLPTPHTVRLSAHVEAPHPTPPSPASPTPHTLHPTPLPTWQQSTWHAGLVLAATSYLFLLSKVLPDWTVWGLLTRIFWHSTAWGGMWLVTPIALTVLGSRRNLPQRRSASALSVVALFIVQILLFDAVSTRLMGLGTAVVLMFINTHQLRRLNTAVITIGFGLAFAADAIWEGLRNVLKIGLNVNLLAIALLLLWLLWGWLNRRDTPLTTLYKQAANRWAIALAVVTLTLVTLCHLAVYSQLDSPHWQYVSAAGILFLATSYRTWQRPQNAGFYAIAWSLELVITGIVSLTGRSLDAVAIANLALGLGTQLLGDWWIVRGVGRGVWGFDVSAQPNGVGSRAIARSNPVTEPTHPSSLIPHPSSFSLYPSSFILSSFHLIPLLYALVGLLLQHRSFTATTGLYTLAAVLVGIGVGRRKPFKPLLYLSVLGGSIAAYELLLYQLSQAKGGEAGDGLVLMAALAAAIAIVVRLLQRWLIPYLRLSAQEVEAIAPLHWGLGTALMPLALVSSLSDSGEWLWTGIAATLATYALAMGREGRGERREGEAGEAAGTIQPSTPHTPHPTPHTSFLTWTYAGIIEAIAAFTYLLHQLLPESVLLTWGGTIAAGVAFLLYQLPWRRWGWQRQPWERSVALLPLLATVLTFGAIATQGLFIVAAFYAWLAKAERQVRLSYLSVLLADWAVLRWLDRLGTTEPLWYAALFSLSLLYLAQVDPGLRSTSDREKRHLLRSLATGLVCLTAFYQAEVGIAGAPSFLPGLLSLGLQLGFIVAGLLLRTRAFLFVGTALFMLQVLRQVWRFIDNYSLLLWAMGIALGLIFIWVAATFEARRSQISALMQYWVTELEAWE